MTDTDVNSGRLQDSLYDFVRRLFPICRSITGNGVRDTLRIIGETIPLEITEVPSGTAVLDWTVPREWNIREAWIQDPTGRRVVDFRSHNLHVVNYSVPVHERLSLAELKRHLHTLPEHPDWIPYRTSYYDEAWGFCLSQRQLDSLPDGEYEVLIDSTLEAGSLTYGELVVPGTSDDELLISTHVCHPSLCDDNLTGISISVHLALAFLKLTNRRLTLRFLFAPGTIGAITWLHQNRTRAHQIKHGLTLTCLGDAHPFTYKRTVSGSSIIDVAAENVLTHSGLEHNVIDFFPYGYDERQYNSPGFRLAVGSLMRGRHGQFPEYHTSADNLEFITGERMLESYKVLYSIIDTVESNLTYRNTAPFGEPQLGSRGLYRALGGTNIPNLQLAMLWALNLSDGHHSLLDIASRSKLSFASIRAAADLLVSHGLLIS